MKTNRNLVFLIIIMLVNALSYGTIIPLMYPYASRFGIGPTGLGFLFASFSLAQFLATPIIGRLSDKHGRKPLLLLSLLGTAASLALFALAWSAPMLFIARILDGITGGNISVAQAAIADVTKPSDRAKAFGMLGAAFGFGFAAGPALGGLLSRISLSAPFWLASTLALVGVLVGWFWFEETNNNREERPARGHLIDVKGMVDVLFSPSLGAVFIVSFTTLVGLNAMILGFQSYSVDVLKLSAAQVGLLFTMFGVIQIIMQGMGIGWLMKRIDSKRRLIRLSLLSSGMAMMAISLGWGAIGFTLLMWVFGILNSPVNAVISALISERSRPEDQGGMMGLGQSYNSLAQVIGPLLAGMIIQFNIHFVFLLSGLLSIISFWLARGIPAAEKSTIDL